jgi:hypothetical protein
VTFLTEKCPGIKALALKKFPPNRFIQVNYMGVTSDTRSYRHLRHLKGKTIRVGKVLSLPDITGAGDTSFEEVPGITYRGELKFNKDAPIRERYFLENPVIEYGGREKDGKLVPIKIYINRKSVYAQNPRLVA